MKRKKEPGKGKSLKTAEKQITRELISQLQGLVAVYIDAANLENRFKHWVLPRQNISPKVQIGKRIKTFGE
ncbi:MAG: hypothetical protein ACOZBZ_00390 [Patescibacteria group bacterium]